MSAALSIYEGGSPLDSPLALFIVQMLLVVIISRVLTKLFKYIKRTSPSLSVAHLVCKHPDSRVRWILCCRLQSLL